MADDSSRTRKVRGRKIRSDRSSKAGRRAKKELARTAAANARDRDGDSPLSEPDEVVPELFVETDAVASLRDRITGWLEADQPVHLIGPTGCGKTALALSAAAERGRPVVWLNGDEAVDTAALVGAHAGGERYKEDDRFVGGVSKQTEIVRERWVDNPLRGSSRGRDARLQRVLAKRSVGPQRLALGVRGGRPRASGKARRGSNDRRPPEFRAIVTSNDVEYAGVHDQQDALLDRFVGVHVDYYDEETEREIVSSHVDLPEEDVETIVRATRALRDELDVVVGTRAAITAATGITVFDGDEEAIDEGC